MVQKAHGSRKRLFQLHLCQIQDEPEEPDGDPPALYSARLLALHTSQGARSGRFQGRARGGKRFDRTMCQRAAIPSFHPIFFPSE